MMKTISIKAMLKLRITFNILFLFSIFFYGFLLINFIDKDEVGLVWGILVIILFCLSLLFLAASLDCIYKGSDPLNSKNRSRYTTILLIEISFFFIIYLISEKKIENKNIIFILYYVLSFITVMLINKNIFRKYTEIKNKGELDTLISNFNMAEFKDIQYKKFYNSFIKFFGYIVSLIIIYKYTLTSWIITAIFMLVNIVFIIKLFWEGIKKIIKNSLTYFVIICIVSSLGIILMKAIYSKIITVSLFKNRDSVEYLMVLVLFYLPLTKYGCKLLEINKKTNFLWRE